MEYRQKSVLFFCRQRDFKNTLLKNFQYQIDWQGHTIFFFAKNYIQTENYINEDIKK